MQRWFDVQSVAVASQKEGISVHLPFNSTAFAVCGCCTKQSAVNVRLFVKLIDCVTLVVMTACLRRNSAPHPLSTIILDYPFLPASSPPLSWNQRSVKHHKREGGGEGAFKSNC